MFRTRLFASFRRLNRTLIACTVMGLGASGCDKVKAKLYPAPVAVVDQSWVRDSSLVAKGLPLLFRITKRGSQQFMIPIAVLEKAKIRTLRMSKRGWNYLDAQTLNSERTLTPVQNGVAGAPVRIRQRMWENAAEPLDSVRGCPNMVPVIRVPMPDAAKLAVINFKLPTNMKTLSAGEVEAALAGIPQLVAPTVGVRAAQLARYTRTVRQVLRVDEPPAVLAEYHDESAITDTSAVESRRPRHLVIVMEKGVYGYRPGWVYSTTGNPNDRPALRFLDSMDVDGDGGAELFFAVTTPDSESYTFAFQKRTGTWYEMWRRLPMRCDA